MGQEFQVPAVFNNKQMSPAFQQALAGQQDSLADGIGQSYPVIGYKGKVWSLRVRGQRYNILRPDDGTPAAYLDVIILNKAPTKSKSFYPKYEPGTSDGERPICASMDGITPDPDVTQKQCDTCALCPRNVFKQDPQTGRKSRECTDYMRLAVLILPTQTKPILGEPLLEPAFLRVPPASLNSLAIMGDTMDRQGFHYASYITRITFDPNKSWPEMIFRPLQQLTDQEAPVILKLRQDPISSRIVGGDIVLPPATQHVSLPPPGTGAAVLASPSVAQATQPVTPALVPPQATPEVPSTPTGLSHVTGVAQAATPSTAGPQPTGLVQADSGQSSPPLSGTTTAVTTGFGGALSAAAPLPSEQQSNGQSGIVPGTLPLAASGATVPDAGEADESDAELDARIAAMINK